MLYVIVYIFVSCFYLSDDRQDIYRPDIADFYGFVALRITCLNGNGHSCCEDDFHERSAAVVAAYGEKFLSGLHNCDCLLWVIPVLH